ncbi:hypothetical protein BV898_05098 [Hypsibius exemplaris]|uniref:Protein sleepless n=1 Tax=Hypsibius exemplaris TaxID=2072580 RepID=A0A1W0X0P1_HYPEX|nr:hypothetical protein BV898_05098 [Hypsibius exemplaris]
MYGCRENRLLLLGGFVVLSTFLIHRIGAADWCFACDSLQDRKCLYPLDSFIHPPATLIANMSTNVYAFTSDSGIDHNKAVALADMIDASNSQRYCDQHKSTENATSFCNYRPRGLRLVNCKQQLNNADNPQCQKIVQSIATGTRPQPVTNTVRLCVGGDHRAKLQTKCDTVTSSDGFVTVTTCTCDGDACNQGVGLSSTVSLLALLYFVVVALALS